MNDFDTYGYEEAAKKIRKKPRTLRAWVAEAKKEAKRRGETFNLIRNRHFNDRLLMRVLELNGCPEMDVSKRGEPNRNNSEEV